MGVTGAAGGGGAGEGGLGACQPSLACVCGGTRAGSPGLGHSACVTRPAFCCKPYALRRFESDSHRVRHVLLPSTDQKSKLGWGSRFQDYFSDEGTSPCVPVQLQIASASVWTGVIFVWRAGACPHSCTRNARVTHDATHDARRFTCDAPSMQRAEGRAGAGRPGPRGHGNYCDLNSSGRPLTIAFVNDT